MASFVQCVLMVDVNPKDIIFSVQQLQDPTAMKNAQGELHERSLQALDGTGQSIPLLQVFICFQMSGRQIPAFFGGFCIRFYEEQTCKATFRAEGPW